MNSKLFTKRELLAIVTTCVLVTATIMATIFGFIGNKKQKNCEMNYILKKCELKIIPIRWMAFLIKEIKHCFIKMAE